MRNATRIAKRSSLTCVAAALLLASCGSGGGGFDDGSRKEDAAAEAPGALEAELRAVKPGLREGVQKALACERRSADAAGRTTRVDARRIRETAARYERDPGIADCGADGT